MTTWIKSKREPSSLTAKQKQLTTLIISELAKREVKIDIPDGVDYEEDVDDASNQDAKTAESANV